MDVVDLGFVLVISGTCRICALLRSRVALAGCGGRRLKVEGGSIWRFTTKGGRQSNTALKLSESDDGDLSRNQIRPSEKQKNRRRKGKSSKGRPEVQFHRPGKAAQSLNGSLRGGE